MAHQLGLNDFSDFSAGIFWLYIYKSTVDIITMYIANSVTRRKSPNVYKSWPKMISLEKW